MGDGTPSLASGQVFHGRYEVVRCLKAGGMGAVYEVIHLETKRRRALKVMLPSIISNADMRARFKLEATVAADIESEHIVETFDAGVDQDTGSPFLVMELLRGMDLTALLEKQGALGARNVVTYLTQAALALDKTHAAGIVHRDLKPDNLYITYRDDGSPRLKILDFGIAKVVSMSAQTGKQTATIGTPLYMSPEQVQGDGRIGPRADLYALGHIAYALLTGEPYWAEEGAVATNVYGLLMKVVAGAVEPPTARAGRRRIALPPAFDAWFAKATASAPQHRFERASEQVAALAHALGVSQSVPTGPEPPPYAGLASPAGVEARSSDPAPAPRDSAAPTHLSGPHAEARSGAPHIGRTTSPVSSEPLTPPPRHSAVPLLVGGVAILALLAGGGLAVTRAMAPSTASAPSASAPTATDEAAGSPVTSATATAAPVAAPDAPPPQTSAVPTSAAVSAAPKKKPPLDAARDVPTHTPTAVAAPAPPAPAPKAGPTPNCDPPFTVGADGIRRIKPECK